MSDTEPSFDRQTLEAMNEKAIQNQFFTPDRVYLDLALFKDFPLGIVFADHMMKNGSKEEFSHLQTSVLSILKDYQNRVYDTVEPFLISLGYDDAKLKTILSEVPNHDLVFALSPSTKFLELVIRHTVRNQNNSGPANKFIKKKIENSQYVMEPIPVTYHINTYPLTLSSNLLNSLGKELGESLGVNIVFMNKDPSDFNRWDWDHWLKDIECFYFNSLGRFTDSPFVLRMQGDMAFMGCYFFARKRFEKSVMDAMKGVDFEEQIQVLTPQLDMMCDFSWLQNNDLRLTEDAEHIPFEDDSDTDNKVVS